MSDYRNAPIKFLNAGLDLNLPSEAISEQNWRKLDNIRVLRESVLEGRMHSGDFLTSSYFTSQTYNWTTGGIAYRAIYPDSYRVGRLVYFSYVGKLKDGTPAYLSVHENSAALAWERSWMLGGTGINREQFSCFLNGIPIAGHQWKGYVSGSGFQAWAPLSVSASPPSVVRMIYPEGPSEVIIDGRWRITPSNVDPSNIYPAFEMNTTSSVIGDQIKVWAMTVTNSSFSEQVAPAGTIRCIPATMITPYTVPYDSTHLVTATATGTGNLSGSYTYLNTFREKKTGVRSIAAGEMTTAVTIATTTTSGITVTQYRPADPAMDQIELWRRGGTIGDVYRLVITQTDDGTGSYLVATPATVTYHDVSADADIALNEALDSTLVWPFPSVDRNGNGYKIIPINTVIVYNLGFATITTGNSGNLITGVGTSGATDAPLWTSAHTGYDFHLFGDANGYEILTVTAATTGAAAQLVIDAATTVYSTMPTQGQYWYTIERDPVPLRAFGPFLGQYVFFIGDPVKRSTFYWSNQGKPNLSSADLNFNTLTDPAEELVNGIMYGATPLCFSKRKLYTFDYGGPDATPTFVPREIPLGLGLSARYGLAANLSGVFFVHNSGVYVTDAGGGPPTLLSKGLNPLFRGDSIAGHPAVDWTQPDEVRLHATSRELHLFYRGLAYYDDSSYPPTVLLPANELVHLVYDFATQAWSRWTGGYGFAYEQEDAGVYRLILGKADSDDIRYTEDANRESGADIYSASARTGSWDAGIPLTDKEFGVLMLDFDPDGTNIRITPRYNSDTEVGTPFETATGTDTAGRRTSTFSLGNVFKRSISFEFGWNETTTQHPLFYQGQVLFRADEEGIVHWFIPPTSLGQNGWFHLKDSYWTLRSSAAVTLSVTIDGVTDTYTIPTTNGARVKNYVEFRPRRGKLYSFSLDSAQPFFFYGEDSAILGKPWKSQTAYQPLNVFEAAGYAQYLRNEGGT